MRFRSWPRSVTLTFGALAAGAASGVAALAWGALVTGGSACTSATTLNAALISGIKIDTGLLLGGDNFTCGEGADDIFKYVAVVIDQQKNIEGAGIFDCYADAVFANLPGTDAGTLSFAVWVYAYNETQFNAANQDNQLVTAVNLLNGLTQPDGSVIPVPTSSVPDGGASRGYAGALSRICLEHATYTATCQATSQPGVEVAAYCTALDPEGRTPSACSLPVTLPDGGRD